MIKKARSFISARGRLPVGALSNTSITEQSVLRNSYEEKI